MIRTIANGETSLLAEVQILDEFGRTVRIDKALAAAASHLEAPVPGDCVALVQKACQKVGIEPPSNKMNEIARAIFDALRAATK